MKNFISDRLNIPVQQQKLILRGKPLHDGSLKDHAINDGCKLHLMVSGTLNPLPTSRSPANSALVDQLKLLASKWTSDANAREAFVTAFQTVRERGTVQTEDAFVRSFRK